MERDKWYMAVESKAKRSYMQGENYGLLNVLNIDLQDRWIGLCTTKLQSHQFLIVGFKKDYLPTGNLHNLI
jgi:hypothetical protein